MVVGEEGEEKWNLIDEKKEEEKWMRERSLYLYERVEQTYGAARGTTERGGRGS